MEPDSIRLDAGKKSVGGTGQPVGQGLEIIGSVERWGVRDPEEAGQSILAGARVFYCAFAGGEDDLFAVPFVLVAADLPFVLQDLVVHAREDPRPIVIL